jgi:cytoskeleton protein RodZ
MPESDPDIGEDVIGLGLGERLRSARKARALSLEQVAESLHLDENIVLALEDERYDAFGAPVYIRGHLRAYARLVGLPVDSVLDAYAKADPDDASVSPVIIRDTINHSVSINPITWGFWGMVALVGLALAAYVLQDEAPAPVVVAPSVESPDALQSEAEPVAVEAPMMTQPDETAGPALVPKSENIESEIEGLMPIAESGIGSDAEPVTESPVEPDIERPSRTVQLSLHFRQESWVEISDANRRLLFGLQREGRRRELTAEPPIQLLIGNAGGVDLSVNDEPYTVPVAGVTGKVARFEISTSVVD